MYISEWELLHGTLVNIPFTENTATLRAKTVCNACNSFKKSKEHLMLVKKAIKSEQCPLLLKKDHEDGGRDKRTKQTSWKGKRKVQKKNGELKIIRKERIWVNGNLEVFTLLQRRKLPCDV